MSKIEELIEQLCPEGVEFRELGEVCENIVSGKNVRRDESGEFPVYGSTGIIGHTNIQVYDKECLLIARVGANAGFVHKGIGKFDVSDNTLIINPKNKYNLSFAFYQLSFLKLNNLAVGGGQPLITAGLIKKMKIPIPPLAIQQKIVTILDQFTQLQAELETELQARRAQYEYYRNKLLNFEGKEVEWKTLGEIGVFVRGNGLQKKDFTETGVGCIHYGQIYTYYGIHTDKTKSFVSPELAKTLKKVNKNDLIITNTSENVEDVCKTVAWLGDEEIVTGGHATIFRHNENPKYLAYYTQTSVFSNEKKKYAAGAKVIDVSAKNLAKIKVPIPPIEEQNRIVAILDKFNKLVNDKTEGLPAEIQARRQQYEYYRGKLLDFKRISG